VTDETIEKNALLEGLGFQRIVPVAHYRIAIAEQNGERLLVSILRHAISLGRPELEERAPWDLPLVDVRPAWSSEEAPSVLVERLPRGLPSTRAEARASVPPFVMSFVDQLAEAHAQGRVVGDLHPALVFVGEDGELVACAQRPLRAEYARLTAEPSGVSSTASGMAPMFFRQYLSPRQVRGDHELDEPRDDVFRVASMVWMWRHGQSPFGADNVAWLFNTMNGTPVGVPADELDRLLVRALSREPRERPDAIEIASALRSLGARWKLS
jgi:hypothetical protein